MGARGTRRPRPRPSDAGADAPEPPVTTAVVLAAGAGTRYAGATHKLLAPLRGRTVVEHAVAAAVAAAIGPVVVVVGLEAGVAELVPAGLQVVANPRAADGIATSLQAGVAAARELGAGAVVVGLGDQPFVPVEAWRLVAAATATPLAVATYDGVRGNPVRLAAEVWDRLPADGDEGARVLLRGSPRLVTAVPCPGSSADIDTVEDLRTWS